MSWRRMGKRVLAGVPPLYGLSMALGLSRDFEILAYLKTVRPGWTVYDVGANRGRFTEWFAYRAGARGQVHAFEPVAASYEQLKNRVGGLPQVRCNRSLVGERDGTATVHALPLDPAQSSMKVQTWGNWTGGQGGREEACPITRLDSYVFEAGHGPPRFVKVDAEGAECLVLRGAEKVLRTFKPALFLELNPLAMEPFDARPADVLPILAASGYRSFRLVTSSGIVPIQPDAEVLDDLLARHFSPGLLCA